MKGVLSCLHFMHIIVLEKRSAKNFQKKYIRSYRNILPPTKQDCRGLTFCSSTVRFFPATSIHWDMPSINSPFFLSWKPFVPPSGKKDVIVRSMPISLDSSVILCLTAKHIRTSLKRHKKRDLTTLSWKWNLTAI